MLDPLPYENENTIELSTEIEEIEATPDPFEDFGKVSERKTDEEDGDEPVQNDTFLKRNNNKF